MKFIKILLILSSFALIIQCNGESGTSPNEENQPSVMIRFLGHSSFEFVTSDSLHIITDPFGGTISQYYYTPVDLKADIVTISHSHADHSQTASVQGSPHIIKVAECDTIGSLIIEGYMSEHGKWNGAYQGSNIIFVYRIGDIKIVHLGENRNVTEPEILSAINDADVLIAPVGEIASISFEELNALVRENSIHTVIPSHYSLSTDNRYYGSSTVDEFVEALPQGIQVVYKDSLKVISDMPDQVVVMNAIYSKL